MHILLVEDSWTDRYLLKLSVSEHVPDVEFSECETGEQLFRFVEEMERRTLAGEPAPKPDLIIIDLHLPRGDGREIIKRIRSSPPLCHVPVAVWSGLDATRGKRSIDGFEQCHYFGKPRTLNECLTMGKAFTTLIAPAAVAV